MKALVLSRTELLFLPEIGMVVFLAIFGTALWMVLRPGAKDFYARHRFMALDDNDQENPQ